MVTTKEIFTHIEWHEGEKLCSKLSTVDGLTAARVLVEALLNFADSEVLQKVDELNNDLLHDATAKKRVKELIVDYVNTREQVFVDQLFDDGGKLTDDYNWWKREHPELDQPWCYVEELLEEKKLHAVDVACSTRVRRLLLPLGSKLISAWGVNIEAK